MANLGESKKEVMDNNQVIDLDKLNEVEDTDAAVEVDIDEDAYAVVAPPVAGRYRFRIALGSRGVQLKTQGYVGKPLANSYYSVPLEFTLISDDPNSDGAKMYVTVSTNIARGKSTSTLLTVMRKCGANLQGNSFTPLSQLQALKQWLYSQPESVVEVEWEAGYVLNDKYKVIYNKYVQFPENPKRPGTKQFQFEVNTPSEGVKVFGARLIPVNYLGKTASTGASHAPIPAKVKPISAASLKLDSQKSIEELESELG